MFLAALFGLHGYVLIMIGWVALIGAKRLQLDRFPLNFRTSSEVLGMAIFLLVLALGLYYVPVILLDT